MLKTDHKGAIKDENRLGGKRGHDPPKIYEGKFFGSAIEIFFLSLFQQLIWNYVAFLVGTLCQPRLPQVKGVELYGMTHLLKTQTTQDEPLPL